MARRWLLGIGGTLFCLLVRGALQADEDADRVRSNIISTATPVTAAGPGVAFGSGTFGAPAEDKDDRTDDDTDTCQTRKLKKLRNLQHLKNENGRHATYSTSGEEKLDLDNPFFQPLGTNGRACASCHAPEDAGGRREDSLNAKSGCLTIVDTHRS